MEVPKPTNTNNEEKLEDKIKELKLSLPIKTWFTLPLYNYSGFWSLGALLEGVIAFQTHFQATDTDIILASHPKTGTTWLKSLLFAIANRTNNYSPHPLHNQNPHELVRTLEASIYKKISGNQLNMGEIPTPRLYATHMPYHSLPHSIKTSKARIVYVCRNPYDTFVSLWNFYKMIPKVCEGIKPDDDEVMENHLGMFCAGVSPWGPYDDHVLEYWKASMQTPRKLLFLEYEGLKKEPKAQLKRLAEFVGCPFSEDEENGNVIDEIIRLCSLESLKNLEVNKNGQYFPHVENKAFFGKGEVGDWTNSLSPPLVAQFDPMLEKFKKAGFSFSYYQINS